MDISAVRLPSFARSIGPPALTISASRNALQWQIVSQVGLFDVAVALRLRKNEAGLIEVGYRPVHFALYNLSDMVRKMRSFCHHINGPLMRGYISSFPWVAHRLDAHLCVSCSILTEI